MVGLPKMDGCASLLDVKLESCEALTADGLREFCAHPPPTLQKLDLSYTKLKGKCRRLHVVPVIRAKNSMLVDLPETISKLEKLQNLNLEECMSLTGSRYQLSSVLPSYELKPACVAGLPVTIGDLKNLQNLNLGCCSALTGNLDSSTRYTTANDSMIFRPTRNALPTPTQESQHRVLHEAAGGHGGSRM